MAALEKVLLIEPSMHAHAFTHFVSAAASAARIGARLTIATSSTHASDRDRVETWAATQPHVVIRWLGLVPGPQHNRLQLWRFAWRSLRAVEPILAAEKFDLVAYMILDHALLFLGLPLFRSWLPAHHRAGISGILFRDHGYRPGGGDSIGEKIRATLDRALVRLALRSPAVRKLAFYDETAGAAAAAATGSTRWAPGLDPVELPATHPADAREKLGIPADHHVFLFFGAISSRKGIVESLTALRAADLPREKTTIYLAGRVAPEFETEIRAAVAATEPHYNVLFRPGFTPDDDIPRLYAAADCVLCAYRNFRASSGILLHAAAYGKPAIVSRHGVMHDAVARYDFGAIVDLDDTPAFAAAIRRLHALDPAARAALADRARAYARSMNPEHYLDQFT